jgi:hypothetical protein
MNREFMFEEKRIKSNVWIRNSKVSSMNAKSGWLKDNQSGSGNNWDLYFAIRNSNCKV